VTQEPEHTMTSPAVVTVTAVIQLLQLMSSNTDSYISNI